MFKARQMCMRRQCQWHWTLQEAEPPLHPPSLSAVTCLVCVWHRGVACIGHRAHLFSQWYSPLSRCSTILYNSIRYNGQWIQVTLATLLLIQSHNILTHSIHPSNMYNICRMVTWQSTVLPNCNRILYVATETLGSLGGTKSFFWQWVLPSFWCWML